MTKMLILMVTIFFKFLSQTQKNPTPLDCLKKNFKDKIDDEYPNTY